MKTETHVAKSVLKTWSLQMCSPFSPQQLPHQVGWFSIHLVCVGPVTPLKPTDSERASERTFSKPYRMCTVAKSNRTLFQLKRRPVCPCESSGTEEGEQLWGGGGNPAYTHSLMASRLPSGTRQAPCSRRNNCQGMLQIRAGRESRLGTFL